MERGKQKEFCAALVTVAIFVLWTVAVSFVDVRAIGPNGSTVGFGGLNGSVHRFTGVNMTLYKITDLLGLIPLCLVLSFAVLGAVQMIRRKSLFKVDRSILALGGFYVVVMAVYFLFEVLVINYRPVLIDGQLEASYPSSTTMLVMCVMPTAMMQLNNRIGNKTVRAVIFAALAAFTAFMVIGRLISGVHWFTDIVGGAIISTGLVMMYYCVSGLSTPKAETCCAGEAE